MSGESDLKMILKMMKPILNDGEYVFCTLEDNQIVNFKDVVLLSTLIFMITYL
jgi:uncharacterized protein